MLEQSKRVELRRPRNSALSRERMRTIGHLVVLALLVYVLILIVGGMDRSDNPHRGPGDFLASSPQTASLAGTTQASSTVAPGATSPARLFPSPESGTASGRDGNDKLVNLYYVTHDFPPSLVPVKTRVKETRNKKELICGIVRLLQESHPSAPDLLAPLPRNSKVLATFFKGGDLYLDMSSEFANNHTGDTLGCFCTLQALTNSLTSIDGIERVKFLVSGKERLTFRGHFDLLNFWSFDPVLVREGSHATPH